MRGNRAEISCTIPVGHTIEQYTRPNSSVTATQKNISEPLTDSATGTICTLVIH